MNIRSFDHIVLTVSDFNRSVAFYTQVLGMCHEGRSLHFGHSKINLHRHAGEFSPSAKTPISGSADFCLVVDGDIHQIAKQIKAAGVVIELGPIAREGACGSMQSIYLRDPDGNLVELASYA